MLVVVNRDPRHTIFLSLLLILSLSTGYTIAQDEDTPASVQGKADDRVVVLTFDDAVKSHRTFVAPLLKELGFGATFFVTHRWRADRSNFMTWEEIAEIHRLGFEIGNHSWTHGNFSLPKEAARLPAELALVESELQKVKVPKPTSFAYSGNSFGPEAVEKLKILGYTLARRGMQPEIPAPQSRLSSLGVRSAPCQWPSRGKPPLHLPLIRFARGRKDCALGRVAGQRCLHHNSCDGFTQL
jgi:peptidoglycan-N-acetylglucosamine deacetylase